MFRLQASLRTLRTLQRIHTPHPHPISLILCTSVLALCLYDPPLPTTRPGYPEQPSSSPTAQPSIQACIHSRILAPSALFSEFPKCLTVRSPSIFLFSVFRFYPSVSGTFATRDIPVLYHGINMSLLSLLDLVAIQLLSLLGPSCGWASIRSHPCGCIAVKTQYLKNTPQLLFI